MRLLALNIKDELVSLLEDEIYIVDVAEDINDAIYHSSVRYYNLILLRSGDFYFCKEILENINSRFTAVIIITDNFSKEFEVNLLKNGAIDIIKEPTSLYNILARIETIHRENFQKKMFFNSYEIDLKEESICDKLENKVFLKGKTFSILTYMIKNRHRGSISKDELLHANWHEPEMVSENIIEVNINQIRNALKKGFNDNFIETIRHKGYKVSN
jgi:two-component system, OmpR family, response regulator